eukprot:2431122-Pyramimonas_sp.AAC.1
MVLESRCRINPDQHLRCVSSVLDEIRTRQSSVLRWGRRVQRRHRKGRSCKAHGAELRVRVRTVMVYYDAYLTWWRLNSTG